MRLFPSIESLYSDDERRRRSGERDFGVWWTDPGQTFPTWRVSWIVDTGETYAVSVRGEVRLFVPLYATREAIEQVLAGWADHCNVGGLGWIAERLNAAGDAERITDEIETYPLSRGDA